MGTDMDKMRCKHALCATEVVNQSATAASIPVNKDKITCSKKRVTTLLEYKTMMPVYLLHVCMCYNPLEILRS